MAEVDQEKSKKGKCTICDAYNLKGTWTCECDAVNISRDAKCWKCGRKRLPEKD